MASFATWVALFVGAVQNFAVVVAAAVVVAVVVAVVAVVAAAVFASKVAGAFVESNGAAAESSFAAIAEVSQTQASQCFEAS